MAQHDVKHHPASATASAVATLLHGLMRGGKPVSLRTIDFPSSLVVLVLAPHPDDFDTIAITMRLFQRNGNTIHLLVDRSGSGIEDAYCNTSSLEVKASLREAEQRRSIETFGLPDTHLLFHRFVQAEDGQITECDANQYAIAGHIARIRPDIVVMPHGNDTNTAHRAMYAMYRRIAAATGRTLISFLFRDPKTINMRSHIYVGFDEGEWQWKAALLRMHDSQHQRCLNTRQHGFDERIRAVNAEGARKVGCTAPYAEEFEVEIVGG